MCDKAVSTYSSTMKFVPECIMTKEMCSKAVSRCFFLFDYIPDVMELFLKILVLYYVALINI